MEERQRFFYAQKLRQKDNTIQELREALAQSEANVRVRADSLQQAERENESLREQLAQLQSSIERGRGVQGHAMTQLSGEIAKLREKLKEAEESAARGQSKERHLQAQFQQMSRVFLREQKALTKRNEELKSKLSEQREKLETLVRGSLLQRTEITQLREQRMYYMALLTNDRVTTQMLRETLSQYNRQVQVLKRQMEGTKHVVRQMIAALSGCHEQTCQVVRELLIRTQLEASRRREGEMRIRELQIANRELSRGIQSGYAESNSFWLTVH